MKNKELEQEIRKLINYQTETFFSIIDEINNVESENFNLKKELDSVNIKIKKLEKV